MNLSHLGPRQQLTLDVPPQPLCVAPSVFDAFGWCASTSLHVSRPEGGGAEHEAAVDSLNLDNPRGMYFVRDLRATRILPEEDAEGHSAHVQLRGCRILAPWAIDAATDALYEQRAEPHRELALWVSDFAGLFWGLHDWVHFHNHGPFEQRAATELQCDLTALRWIVINRNRLAMQSLQIERLATRLADLNWQRFCEEATHVDREQMQAQFRAAQAG